MKKLLLIFPVFMILALPVLAEKLKEISIDPEENRFYIDEASIVKKGDIIDVTGVVVLGQALQDKYFQMSSKRVSRNKMNMSFNCSNNTVSHKSFSNFDSENKVIEQFNAKPEEIEWVPVDPDKPNYKIYEYVCKPVKTANPGSSN
ncbi:MAG: surface-adhesin E family protein [Cyanobacteriota bacterium]